MRYIQNLVYVILKSSLKLYCRADQLKTPPLSLTPCGEGGKTAYWYVSHVSQIMHKFTLQVHAFVIPTDQIY